VGSNTISDNAIMEALGRHMTRAVARQTVTAGNLANLETPGYRAKEVTFAN
jgi:flagellar basal-body rod protein FlgB